MAAAAAAAAAAPGRAPAPAAEPPAAAAAPEADAPDGAVGGQGRRRRRNELRVLKRYNRFGWAVDLIEARCSVCNCARQAEIYPMEPPFMTTAYPEDPPAYSADVRDKWARMVQKDYEYWETYTCDGCTENEKRESERQERDAGAAVAPRRVE